VPDFQMLEMLEQAADIGPDQVTLVMKGNSWLITYIPKHKFLKILKPSFFKGTVA